jgi:hypothetical protein
MGLDSLALAFDTPFDSPEHRDLEQNGWIGGTAVTVRFYLGRLIRQNLFRVSTDEVTSLFVQYLGNRISREGAELLRYGQGWDIAELLLRSYFESETRCKSKCDQREIAAIEACLSNPNLSDTELAQMANTTTKQLARMSTLKLARKLPLYRTLSRKSIN